VRTCSGHVDPARARAPSRPVAYRRRAAISPALTAAFSHVGGAAAITLIALAWISRSQSVDGGDAEGTLSWSLGNFAIRARKALVHLTGPSIPFRST